MAEMLSGDLKNLFYGTIERRYYVLVSEDLEADPLWRMLQHCYAHVDYYRDIFLKHGLVQNGKVPVSSFEKIPLLDKESIRRHTQLMIAKNVNKHRTVWNTSGGSTGEPVTILFDRDFFRTMRAITYTQKTWTGYRLGDPLVRLWGDEREILKGTQSPRSKVLNFLRNKTVLNAFVMNETNMKGYVTTLNQIRPRLLVAYAQSIYELCRFVERNGLYLEGIGAVMTSAGTLYPFMRETIESVCRAPVFNRYGSREVGNIASECDRHEGLHVSSGTYVEVVDEGGNVCPDGEEGEIVVTSLANFAMPLLRYRIGDRGAMKPGTCSCGRKGRLLQSVLGRTVDVFRTKNGELIDGEYFTHLFYFRDWVQKFQIIQKTTTFIEISVVKRSSPGPEEISDIKSMIRKVMGDDCRIEFAYKDEIPPPRSGKFRYTISEVRH